MKKLGFWASLSAGQRQRALAYRGPENIGPSNDRDRCEILALKKRARLKRLEKKRRERGDEEGARRASIGAAVAAQIAKEIRRASWK